MRADRLMTLLMLLQTRGQMTARQLAAELEVSQRTIYRDIDALSAAGVPVYAETGSGGGCALLDSYRTNLTGLNEGEMRALFMLSIPAPLADLGLREDLRAALLKLVAALPADRQSDSERVRQRFHLDSNWWFQADEPVPHLRLLHEAVWQDHRVSLTYRQLFDVEVTRLVDPYGLVAKAGIWFVVCTEQESLRVHRVSHLLDVQLEEALFARPDDFDLASFWGNWCRAYERERPDYPVTIRAAPDLMRHLPRYFGERVRRIMTQIPVADDDGWVTLTLHFETFEEARTRLLGFGSAVEVLEPEPLRLSLIDFARQIVHFYEHHAQIQN